jgi:hypothetical protein
MYAHEPRPVESRKASASLLRGRPVHEDRLKNRPCFFKADLRRRGNVSVSQLFRIKIILASFAY